MKLLLLTLGIAVLLSLLGMILCSVRLSGKQLKENEDQKQEQFLSQYRRIKEKVDNK